MAKSPLRSDAVVLRTVDYGEADRIVTLLTRSHGKVAVLGRGARRSKRRFGGAFEAFQVLDVEFAFGRGEVGSCMGASILRAFPGILRDLDKMTHAGRGLEWVRLGVPAHLPEPALFDAVISFFERLDAAEGAYGHGVLAVFLARLTEILGFAPRFDACALCEKPAPPEKPGTFDARLAGLVCRGCGGASMRLSAPLRALLGALSNVAEHEGALGAEGERAVEVYEAILREHVALTARP